IAMTKELVGNYNSAYGFLQLFGILADFGLYAIAVRELSRPEQSTRMIGALFILRLAGVCLSLGTAVLLVWIIPAWRGTPLPLGVTFASLTPFFTLTGGIFRSVFQVRYRMHLVFIAEVLQRILTTALIGLFIVIGIRGTTDTRILDLALIIGSAGAFVYFLLSFLFVRRLTSIAIRWDAPLLRELLRKAFPFGVAYLCIAFYRQFDLTLIALLRPDFELQNAYYGIVARIMDMGFIMPTFLLNSTLPTLHEASMRGKDTRFLLGNTFLTLLLIGSISALFAAFWARPLTMLLTTDSYLATATRPGTDTALRLLSIPLLFNSFIIFPFYTLLNLGKWRRLVSSLLLGSIISLVLNLLLIPSFGFVGAAYTSIIVHLLLALLLFPQGLKAMPLRLAETSVMRLALFLLILTTTLAVITPFLTSTLFAACGLAAMAVFLVLMGWALGISRLFPDGRDTLSK
ncbi:MAG: oligosaccharide flippase family protein, partial [Candidatus Peribacteraceae bacterium]|nr:oligosaccharide flippase family protein [Candidatus Peribacteraceae bacterium]